jgi:hypothetical protein
VVVIKGDNYADRWQVFKVELLLAAEINDDFYLRVFGEVLVSLEYGFFVFFSEFSYFI